MIYKYEVIAPVTNKQRPHFDKRSLFIVPIIKKNYKYYIECARYNPNTFSREYFLLLSEEKFDNNCRKCRVDNYGRLKLILHGECKCYAIDEIAARGNIDVEYLETEDVYDIYLLR